MQIKWDPIAKYGSLEAFKEVLLEKRGVGKTWRAIGHELGVSKTVLYKFFGEHPEFKAEIKAKEKAEIKDNIRQTLLEVALKKKNVVALIFLSKAICKMYDTPKAPAPEDDKPKEEMHTGMTREQWKKLHEERQARVAK